MEDIRILSPGRQKAIITTVRASIYGTYEHLGTKLTIEGEGSDHALLIQVLEAMVENIKSRQAAKEG